MILSSKIHRIRGNGGTETVSQSHSGSGADPSLQLHKDVLPTYSSHPHTAGYKEPGKAHSTINRFGESDRIEEKEGFWHR